LIIAGCSYGQCRLFLCEAKSSIDQAMRGRPEAMTGEKYWSSKFRELEILPNEARSGPGALSPDVRSSSVVLVKRERYEQRSNYSDQPALSFRMVFVIPSTKDASNPENECVICRTGPFTILLPLEDQKRKR
ncbi:MAG TPA: hypothetical protein VFS84_17395, partial [Candidatus Binatia bacterium]|nr:hypothetical protein [Candidatus Binatia bacterium]